MRTNLCRGFVLVCPVLLGIFWQDLTVRKVKNFDQAAPLQHFWWNSWFITFLNLFLMSAYVSSLSCLPVLGLWTRKSLFLVFTSLTSMAVFLLFRIWKKNPPFPLILIWPKTILGLVEKRTLEQSWKYFWFESSSAYLDIEAIIWTILIRPDVRRLLPGHSSLHTHLFKKLVNAAAISP